MRLKFTKMQGLGNDFVVLDGVNQRIELSAPQLKRLADRHFGVGCDQILVVEKPSRDDVDFRYRIFNADGGEVEQCGNGAGRDDSRRRQRSDRARDAHQHQRRPASHSAVGERSHVVAAICSRRRGGRSKRRSSAVRAPRRHPAAGRTGACTQPMSPLCA